MFWVRRSLCLLFIIIGVLGLSDAMVVLSQKDPSQKVVAVLKIEGTIDQGLSPFVKRSLLESASQEVNLIVLDITTPGGRLDSALEIRDAVLKCPIPVVAFVNREALSAGALISLAAHFVYMTPGALLGAATPVTQDGSEATEKVASAVRSAFRSSAEARGRDPLIAEAMVDESIEIEGLVESGKLLTLTTEEALIHGYADGQADDLAGLLQVLDMTGAEIIVISPNWSERLVRVITNPIFASILISFGILGIFTELTSPGFGVPGVLGIILLALFFWGHLLAGFAGWEGIVLVSLGLGLLAVELFVIPGFGIPGILGLGAIVIGFYLSLIDQGADDSAFIRAGMVLAGSSITVIIGVWLIIKHLPRGRMFRGLSLQSSLPRGSGILGDYSTHRSSKMPTKFSPGARGVAITALRPAGIAEIDNRRTDVVTQGDFVEQGMIVEIVVDEGYRRVVRPVNDNSDG